MTHIIDPHIDYAISAQIVARNAKKEADHKSSGKLSASRLGDPVQWQILYSLGVPQKKLDEFVLRKFLRGNQVENFIVDNMPNIVDKQKFVEYRGVVGYVDAIVDTSTHPRSWGVIPHEVKSITNRKYKRVLKENTAQRGHILQACLYALGLNTDHFAIDYVASDDLRIITFVFETAEFKSTVDAIIDQFNRIKELGIIPPFEAIEKWHENPEYSKYYEWKDLSGDEAMKKFNQLKITT